MSSPYQSNHFGAKNLTTKSKQKNISRWFSAGLLAIALQLHPLPGGSQESKAETQSPISVEVEITPMQAMVGDLITYSIRVRHDPNIEPSAPHFIPPEGLEAVDQGTRELPQKKSQRQREFWFRMRADLVGSYEFSALPIPFIVSNANNDGKHIPGQAVSPTAQLEIQSILHLQGEPKDIRDIKPLININRDWRPIALAVLAAALVIALVIFIYRKRRKIKSGGPTIKQKLLSPQEAAMRELQLLQEKELLERGLMREYYFELSEIFRRYLGAQFNFPALDWTTEEIKNFLTPSTSHHPEVRKKIGFILEQTDLVKFAKAEVTRDEDMTQEVILFIQETSRPVEPEPVGNDTATTS